MSEQKNYRIIAEGKLSLYEADMVQRWLGSRGLSNTAEIVQIQENDLDNEAEPKLGFIDKEAFLSLGRDFGSESTAVRTWNALSRARISKDDSYWTESDEKYFEENNIDGVMFRVSGSLTRQRLLELNRDVLKYILEAPFNREMTIFKSIPNLGAKAERFSWYVIEERQEELEKLDDLNT